MAFIDPLTTPITLERFKTIPDSKGMFATWTDIIDKAREGLPVNVEILGTVLKGTTQVVGDNVVLENISNKQVMLFNDDVLKFNNKMSVDKWVMFLYDDFMLNMEYSIIDEKSAIEWSNWLSQEVATMYQARNDFTNLQTIDEVQSLAIALGSVKLLPNADKEPPLVNGAFNFQAYKQLAYKVRQLVKKLMRTRSAFQKGFSESELKLLIGQDLAGKLLMSITDNSAAPQAFSDFKSSFEPYNILGQVYEATMYLEENVLQSEFAKADGTIVNQGINTGQQIKPYQFANTAMLLVFMRSLLNYGHLFPNITQTYTGSRTKKVDSFIWRMNAAVNPIFARNNYAFFYNIPVFDSYTEYTTGNVIPAYDLSTAAGMNSWINKIYTKQPQLYKAFFNGNSTLTQADVDKIWSDAVINWEPGAAPYVVEKGVLKQKKN